MQMQSNQYGDVHYIDMTFSRSDRFIFIMRPGNQTYVLCVTSNESLSQTKISNTIVPIMFSKYSIFLPILYIFQNVKKYISGLQYIN